MPSAVAAPPLFCKLTGRRQRSPGFIIASLLPQICVAVPALAISFGPATSKARLTVTEHPLLSLILTLG
jgi:hypothetical protein